MQAGARLKLVLGSDKRLVAIGGIKAEDGSSLLTASLGAALANLEQNRVLVVDANTRNSRLSKIFGIAEGEGFLNVLEEEADIDQLTKLASPSNLDFLGLGRSCRSLAALLGAPRSRQVIDAIRQRYRYVLVDCGTVCDSPDNMLLASMCDGIVGAAAAAARTRTEIVGFRQALTRLQIPLLGIVLTKR
jgi:Mrp family chromosome partitioning ATPase